MNSKNPINDRKYDLAFMGGTFDRFHIAHKSLIETAVAVSKHVFVGIVSDELGEILFAKKNHADKIQDYNTRYASVHKFISTISDNFELGSLTDPWGPAPLRSTDNGVLVVSRETEKVGETINSMRLERGLHPLDVVVIPWVYDDEGNLISSTMLRERELS